jgi:hypothetical protein
MIRAWLSHPIVDLALKALTRNRLQTGLTLLGMTIGVATVLAMMAVGAGAQASIEQQVRAAGLNQLTVRAGNWRPKVEDTGEAVAHGVAGARPGAWAPPVRWGRRPDRLPPGRRSDGETRPPARAAAPGGSRGGAWFGGHAQLR